MNANYLHKPQSVRGFTPPPTFSARKLVGGVTLVEMIVAIGLFTIVTFLVMSAFLTVISADRHSRGLRIATDNLNLALEDMSRRIKTGTQYNCGGGTGTNDCVDPGPSWGAGKEIFEFIDQEDDRIKYQRGVGPGPLVGGGCGAVWPSGQGCIVRVKDFSSAVATSPEIDIKDLKFWVYGSSEAAKNIQPFVRILVGGSVKASATDNPEFQIETMITQREMDL